MLLALRLTAAIYSCDFSLRFIIMCLPIRQVFRLLLSIPTLIFLIASSSATAEVVNVVLVAGQSNASGRAVIAGLPASPFDTEVEFYYDTDVTGASTRLDSNGQFFQLAPPSSTFGPEMALGRTLTHKGIENLAIVKVTRGGTNLRTDWEKGNTGGDEMYSLFIDTVGDAFNAIQQRGDTINVVGLAWHQGEGDAGNERNNPGNYQTNLTQFISDVRSDLSLPNLPFMIGGVFEPNREELYAAQQATAAAVAHTEFISSTETTVFDVTTHLDGKSQLWMGTRFANALTPNQEYVEFEPPNFDAGLFADQNGWLSSGSSENRIVSTETSGRYVAGQAAGHVDSGGTEYLGTKTIVPVYGNSMSANFFAGDAMDHDQDGSADYDDDGVSDSSVRLFGWIEDVNDDGFFSGSSNDTSSIGFGLDNDGTINIKTAEGNEISTGVAYSVDNWYQLTLSWSEANNDGDRQVSLFAENLTSDTALNGGTPIFTAELTAAQFGADPSQWIGTGIRATRGLVDNIHFDGGSDALVGDYNADGIVDAADYTVWRDKLGTNEILPNDYTSGIGMDDYIHWRDNFGAMAASYSNSFSVPEPSCLVQIIMAVSLASSHRLSIRH